MSYTEYNDLYIKAQEKGNYKIFSYDMVGSRKCTDPNRNKLLLKLLLLTYKKIQIIELKTKKKILYKNEKFSTLYEQDNEFHYDKVPLNVTHTEPFLIGGDQIGFTIIKNTINDNLIDHLFEEAKKELGITYDFHKANGIYETDEWSKGDIYYYRGYLIQLLAENHKTML